MIDTVIVDAALGKNPHDTCATALAIFASCLGAEAGNMALKVLATKTGLTLMLTKRCYKSMELATLYIAKQGTSFVGTVLLM